MSRDYKLQFHLAISALTSTLLGCLTREERFFLISADWTDFIQSLKFSVSRSSYSRLRWFVCFFFANLDSRYTYLFSAFNLSPVYSFRATWTIIVNFVINHNVTLLKIVDKILFVIISIVNFVIYLDGRFLGNF